MTIKQQRRYKVVCAELVMRRWALRTGWSHRRTTTFSKNTSSYVHLHRHGWSLVLRVSDHRPRRPPGIGRFDVLIHRPGSIRLAMRHMRDLAKRIDAAVAEV